MCGGNRAVRRKCRAAFLCLMSFRELSADRKQSGGVFGGVCLYRLVMSLNYNDINVV